MQQAGTARAATCQGSKQDAGKEFQWFSSPYCQVAQLISTRTAHSSRASARQGASALHLHQMALLSSRKSHLDEAVDVLVYQKLYSRVEVLIEHEWRQAGEGWQAGQAWELQLEGLLHRLLSGA